MEKYKQLQKFIIGFLVFYFIAGLSTEFFLDGREKDYLPFFSWFLFSHTPDEKSTQYTIRIIEFDGKTFNPPVFLNQAYGIVDQPNSPKLRELIRKLSASTLSGSTRESEQLRMLLEQIYLPEGPIRYELVMVTYNPIRRFEMGELESVRQLGEFTKK